MKPIILALGLIAGAHGAAADPLIFEGRIEPLHSAAISTRLDGVVETVLFRGGQTVQKGAPLITLDPADAKLNLAIAQARLAGAKATFEGAQRANRRQEELLSRGVAPEAAAGRTRTDLAAAQAAVDLAQTERDRAALDLDRTTITAPIAGVISQPRTSIGTYVEAEAGPPIATIVSLDPVLVAYDVPYAARVFALDQSGAPTLDKLLERISLELVLPNDAVYPHRLAPEYASAGLDRQSGALTVWATVPNPDTVLRPGLKVTVRAQIAPDTQSTQ